MATGRRPVRSRTGFVRAFFHEFLHEQFIRRRISRDRHDQILDHFDRLARDIAEQLFASGRVEISQLGHLALRWLREPGGKDFPFIHVVSAGEREPITCFVGHRFDPAISRSLRFNLATLFEPHRIDLRWSGRDVSFVDVFTDILDQIRGSRMCIFDSRGTRNRPNVYIETGIAFALGRPLVFCEYASHPTIRSDAFPSDFAGLLRLRYRNYEHLCRQLYIQLPFFLERNKLA